MLFIGCMECKVRNRIGKNNVKTEKQKGCRRDTIDFNKLLYTGNTQNKYIQSNIILPINKFDAELLKY